MLSDVCLSASEGHPLCARSRSMCVRWPLLLQIIRQCYVLLQKTFSELRKVRVRYDTRLHSTRVTSDSCALVQHPSTGVGISRPFCICVNHSNHSADTCTVTRIIRAPLHSFLSVRSRRLCTHKKTLEIRCSAYGLLRLYYVDQPRS